MKKKTPMFQIRTEIGFNNRVQCYELYGKGKGVGDGISWTWVGTLPKRSYCYLMIKAITLMTKENFNG